MWRIKNKQTNQNQSIKMQVRGNLSHYLIWIFSPASSLLNPQFISVDSCLYLCGALSSHQTLCRCADGQISRWKKKKEGEREGGWCVFLSILSGSSSSRSMGGGEVWEECREQGPSLPLAFCLLFTPLLLSFFSFPPFFLPCVEIGCHSSCVAPHVRTLRVREERGLFVLMTVSRPPSLRVEMFNHSPVAVTGCSRKDSSNY